MMRSQMRGGYSEDELRQLVREELGTADEFSGHQQWLAQQQAQREAQFELEQRDVERR